MANNFFNDISGHKFNMLTVINRSDKKSSRGVVWECKCDCGGLKDVVSTDLKNGNVKSCGCISKIGLSIGHKSSKSNSISHKCPECNIEFKVKVSRLIKSSYVCCSMGCKTIYVSKNPHKNGKFKNRSDIQRFFDEKVTRLKSSSRKRGKEFEFAINGKLLNDMWMKQDGKCFYSGIDMSFDPSDKLRLVSVDRIDNSKGYILNNIVLCTYAFNSFKFNLSHSEIIDFISLIKGSK